MSEVHQIYMPDEFLREPRYLSAMKPGEEGWVEPSAIIVTHRKEVILCMTVEYADTQQYVLRTSNQSVLVQRTGDISWRINLGRCNHRWVKQEVEIRAGTHVFVGEIVSRDW